jgi:MFS transporter, putative metabolite:H+ symporter
MYGVGALLALLAVVLRVELPESPRWLVGQNRVAEADAVVSKMDERASRHRPLPPPTQDDPVDTQGGGDYRSFAHVLGNRIYLRRVLVLMSMWFFCLRDCVRDLSGRHFTAHVASLSPA